MKQIIFLLSFVLIPLLDNAQHELWGMTSAGGQFGYGVIFKTDGDGTNYTIARDFAIDYEGSYPVQTKLCKATNGKLYGMTNKGGVNNLGVIFEFDPLTHSYSKKLAFSGASSGSKPQGSFIQVSNGKLYGMTNLGGANGLGALIEYDITSNTCVVKYSFGGVNGSQPCGSLLMATNGKIYGMAASGGVTNNGVLFEFDLTTGIYTKKIDFNGTANGSGPFGGTLMQASNGNLYGMCSGGGISNNGVLFEYDITTNNITKKIDFDGSNSGSDPRGSLIELNNKLYGMTTYGGTNSKGVLFDLDLTTSIYTKHLDFSGAANGAYPYGDLELAPSGKFYGMVQQGGTSNVGVLFEYDPVTDTYLKHLDFNYTNGAYPQGSLMLDSSGKFYGLATEGGAYNGGVIFEYDQTTDNYLRIINLNGSNGRYPCGGLIKTPNGKLYGMTLQGGENDKGVIFEYDPILNIYTKKIDFDVVNGASPQGSLFEADNGKLYGMTSYGGINNKGVLFEYDYVTNTYVKKVDFAGVTNGEMPYGNLMQANNGLLYGMTRYGGSSNKGTLFEYDKVANTITKKVDCTYTNGQGPMGSLVQASNNKLYGMTESGGTNLYGVLFEYDPATSIYTKKLDLGTTATGSSPTGNLINTSSGKLYGMTNGGGVTGHGVIFEYDIATNSFITKYNLSGLDGSVPYGSLTEGYNGKLYATANQNTGTTMGTIFEYDPTLNVFVKRFDFNGTNGKDPRYGSLLDICVPPSAPLGTGNQNLCVGNTLSDLNVSGLNINWYASATSTVVISSTVTPVNGNHYFASQTNGCESINRLDVLVNVNPLPTLTVIGTNTVCLGTSTGFISTGAMTYTWSTGQTTSSISVNPTSTTIYTVWGSNMNGCINSQTVSLTVNTACADVWPGDANSDGVADNLDVLELGLHYTQTGAPRAATSNSWQSYFVNNWTGTITNGKNLNHSDCNGDGTINDDDTLAIYNNYGLTHTFKPVQTNTVNPQLSIVPDQPMVAKGTWGTASIYLGDATTNINNINGVAFTVDFDNTLIEPSNVWIEYQNSFMDASQNLYFRKLDFTNSKLFTASTHTVSNNVSGFSKIATLHYQILSSLTTDQVLNIGLSQANQSNASGIISSLTSGTGTLMAIGASVGVKDNLFSGNVLISPNPTNGILNISFNAVPQNTRIELYNSIGALVLTESMSNKNNTINVSDLSIGIYFMKVLEGNKVVAVKKVVKE